MTAKQAEFFRVMMRKDTRKRDEYAKAGGRPIYYTSAIRLADCVLRGVCDCPAALPDYEQYRQFSDDGHGHDIETGKPIQTYEEWIDGYRLDFAEETTFARGYMPGERKTI